MHAETTKRVGAVTTPRESARAMLAPAPGFAVHWRGVWSAAYRLPDRTACGEKRATAGTSPISVCRIIGESAIPARSA